MPSTGYIPQPLADAPPAPDFASKVKAQPAEMSQSPGGPLPESAGWGGKAGAGAYIASNLLSGWMAGKKKKEDRMREKAETLVGGSRGLVDVAGRSYQNLLNQGKDEKDPEVQNAKKALTAAWTNYITQTKQYAFPDAEAGGKKGIKGKLSEKFLAQKPQMIAMSALKALEMTDPATLFTGPTAAEKAKSRLETADAETKEKRLKDENRWRDLSMKDQGALTDKEKKEQEGLETVLFNKGPKERAQDTIWKKVAAGQTVSPQELREVNITPETPLQQFHTNDKGHVELLTVDSAGNVTRKDTGAREKLPESAASALTSQFNAAAKLIRKSYPNYDETQVNQLALNSIGIRGDATQWANNQFALDRAIKQVKAQNKDSAGIYDNFVAQSADGVNFYRSEFAKPTDKETHWFSPDVDVYSGGVKKSELAAQEAEFRDKLVTTLMHDNKKLTREQAIAMLPQPVYQGKAEPVDLGMKPTPTTGGSDWAPPPGQAFYQIDVNGKQYKRAMAPDEYDAFKKQYPGVSIQATD